MRIHRARAFAAILLLCFISQITPAQAAEATPSSTDALQKEIDQLKSELQKLRAENDELRQKLAQKDTATAKPPATAPKIASGEIKFELGEEKSIAGYKYRSPAGWVAQSVKGSTLGITYVSPDKAHAILLQIRLKGAAPAEMQGKFADSVLTMQKGQLTKSKTEVVEVPTIQIDTRFYCRFQEKIKVKPDKTALQLHLYRNVNKDMVEVTAITTGEDTEIAARVVKMAEDLTLGAKPEK